MVVYGNRTSMRGVDLHYHCGMLRCSLILAFVLSVCVSPISAQERTAAKQEVLSVIDRFFACMTTRDSAGMAAILEPEGLVIIVDADDPAKPVRTLSHIHYLARVKKGEGILLERYWDPTIRMDSTVAVVSCPYDFHFNGTFSHCGVDIFTLARRNGQWRIASTAFSMRKQGCEPGPLGPLKP